jgi:hypothetical protein
MSEERRLKPAHAIRKAVLVTRIELRREQLKLSSDRLRAALRSSSSTSSARIHPAWQALMTLALPCGAYFASGRRGSLAEAVRFGWSLAELLNRVLAARPPESAPPHRSAAQRVERSPAKPR